MLYYFLFTCLALLGFLDVTNIKKEQLFIKKIIFYFFLSLFFILGSLRWKTGTDWVAYYNYFTYSLSLEDFIGREFEIGYGYLNYLIKTYLYDDYTILLTAQSFICIVFIALTFKSKFLKKFPIICLLIYFSSNLGGIFAVRQSISISIVYFAYICLLDDRKKLFFILVYIATLFHNSAFIAFFLYFFIKINLSNRSSAILLISSFIIGLITSTDFLNLLLKIPIVSNIPYLKGKIQDYTFIHEFYGSNFSSNVDTSISKITGIIKKMFIFLPLVYFRKNINEKHMFFNKIFSTIIMGQCFYLIFGSMLPVLKRANAYFDVADYIFLCCMLSVLKLKNRIILYTIIVLFLFSNFFNKFYAYRDLYDPYYWIFDDYIPRITY